MLFKVPDDAFNDADGHELFFEAIDKGSDGLQNDPLPAEISFETDIKTFIIESAAAMSTNIELTATDTLGSTVSETFSISIVANTAPAIEAGVTMPDQTIQNKKSFQFEIPNTLFGDTDNESLVLSIEQGTGIPVPSWFKFSPDNRLCYGVADTIQNQFDLTIIAHDAKGAMTSLDFVLFVSQNTAPVVDELIPDIEVTLEQFFSY